MQGHATSGNSISLLSRPFRALHWGRGCLRVPLRSTLGCSAAPFQGLNRTPPSWGLSDTTRYTGGVFILVGPAIWSMNPFECAHFDFFETPNDEFGGEHAIVISAESMKVERMMIVPIMQYHLRFSIQREQPIDSLSVTSLRFTRKFCK
jgi:hypothetical protein